MKIKKLTKAEFPSALMQIPEPPENLWIIGNLPKPEEDYVYLSIVGSRKNTSYGKEVCERIIKGLRGYPIVIVSGFAMGIDTLAHKSAMEAGLRTIVFPGSGLSEDVMYPRVNANLVGKIVENGGCLLSEFEPDFIATPWSFPQRNRLMAGMSKATLVIEATEMSGTMITARLALEYNRDLLAVPGSIFSKTSTGANKLIRQGAVPVTSTENILEALGLDSTLSKQSEKDRQLNLFVNLSENEKRVIEILHKPLSRDELLRAIKMNIWDANTLLSVLEIKELIKEEMGMMRLT